MAKGVTRVPVCDFKKIFSQKDKINFDEELILPQFLPDIERLVSLKGRCSISNTVSNNNEAEISGLLFLTLIYESEGGILKATEYTLPFKKSYETESNGDIWVRCTPYLSSLSSKLASKRKVNAKAGVILDVEIFSVEENEALESSDDPKIILKEEKEKILVPYKNLYEAVSFSEETASSDIAEILSKDVKLILEKIEPQENSLILKGNLLLSCLFTEESSKDEISTLNKIIPFTKKIDGMDLESDFKLCCDVNVLGVDLSKSDDSDNMLLLECEAMVSLFVFAPEEKLLASDGFSPDFKYEKESFSTFLIKDVEKEEKTFPLSGDILASSDMRSTEACSSFVKNISLTEEDGERKLNCDAVFSVLYKNADEKYLSNESILKCSLPLGAFSKGDMLFLSLDTEDENVSLSEGKLKLSCDLNLRISKIEGKEKELLSEIVLNEDESLNKNKDYPIIICYAESDDTLWDIGKRYKISPKRIKEENKLKEETFKERTPLIIPAK